LEIRDWEGDERAGEAKNQLAAAPIGHGSDDYHDHSRGHATDHDHHDEDNPGRSHD
jgi:hypothetical protein